MTTARRRPRTGVATRGCSLDHRLRPPPGRVRGAGKLRDAAMRVGGTAVRVGPRPREVRGARRTRRSRAHTRTHKHTQRPDGARCGRSWQARVAHSHPAALSRQHWRGQASRAADDNNTARRHGNRNYLWTTHCRSTTGSSGARRRSPAHVVACPFLYSGERCATARGVRTWERAASAAGRRAARDQSLLGEGREAVLSCTGPRRPNGPDRVPPGHRLSDDSASGTRLLDGWDDVERHLPRSVPSRYTFIRRGSPRTKKA